MPSIQISDLRDGDILLERYEGGATHKAIVVGQFFGQLFKPKGHKGKVTTVHAALYVGDNTGVPRVAESSGAGLESNQLGVNHHSWKVYRSVYGAEAANLAADIATQLVDRAANKGQAGHEVHQKFGQYNFGASAFSASARRSRAKTRNDIAQYLDKLYMSGSNVSQKFFCSNFVTLCYQLAGQFISQNPHQYLPYAYRTASPSEMAAYFESEQGKTTWIRVGEVRG